MLTSNDHLILHDLEQLFYDLLLFWKINPYMLSVCFRIILGIMAILWCYLISNRIRVCMEGIICLNEALLVAVFRKVQCREARQYRSQLLSVFTYLLDTFNDQRVSIEEIVYQNRMYLFLCKLQIMNLLNLLEFRHLLLNFSL